MHFLAQYGNVLVSNSMALIKKEKIGLKRAPHSHSAPLAEGGGVCNSFIQGTWHGAKRTIHIWVYIYKAKLSITGAYNSFYTRCTLHCTLDMYKVQLSITGACNFFMQGTWHGAQCM